MDTVGKTRKSAGVFKTLALGAVSAFAIQTVLFTNPVGALEAGGKTDSVIVNFDVKVQPLQSALLSLSEQANIVVVAPVTMTEGKVGGAVSGKYSVRESLAQLLAGTGLKYEIDEAGSVFIRDQSVDTHLSGFKKISMYTEADYAANLGAYEDADEQDKAKVIETDEIIVTASRREQKLQDVPMSITSVDPEEFVTAGLTSLENIIDYTPGVNFNSGGNAGQGNITIRGVSQEGAIPVTAIYIDDVPLTTSTPFAGGSSIFLDGLLGDLERVEIINGPQGTLYGASAMGGIIRYITRDPALEEVRGRASVDLSTTKEGGVTQLYRGMISAPIVEDKFGITVAGFYNDQAGYIDRLDPVTLEVADDNYNVAEIFGVSVTGLLKLSDDASLRLSGLYQKTEGSGGTSVRLSADDRDNIVLESVDGRYAVAQDEQGSSDIEYKKADITFKYAFDWAEFVSVTGYAAHSNPRVGDVVVSQGPVIDFITGSPPGTTQAVPFVAETESEKFIQEFRLSSMNNEMLEWQVGLFYSNDDTNNIQSVTALPQNLLLSDSRFPAEYEEKAAFANFTYYVTPNFDITAGLRYSDSSLDTTFAFEGLFLVNSADTVQISEEVVTYLFNARWRVQDNLSLYARVASGYRPAWVNIPVVDPITGQKSTPIVNSDDLWSYEIGAKGNFLDGRVSYDIAFWTMQWNDFQANLTVNGFGVGGNAGVGQSSHGFEGTLNAVITDQFTMTTTIAHTKSTIDDDSLELFAAKGERTRNLPDWTGSIRATYTYTIGDIFASTGFGLRYTGKSNSTYVGDVDRGIGAGLNILFPAEAVVLADLNASFSKDNITLGLYATNLFNNYEFTSGGIGVDPFGNLNANGNITKPRTIGASLAISF